MKKVGYNLVFILISCFFGGQIVDGQTATPPMMKPAATKATPQVKTAETTVTTQIITADEKPMGAEVKATEKVVGGQDEKMKKPATDDDKSTPPAQTSEEAAIAPYYENAMKEYYLGPRDVISVEVFGQTQYSKANITVPPTGKISYPLIKNGVIVKGKTVEQVAEEITKKLDEFIIDPQVTVFLEKAMSARYSIIGDVQSPGVRVMEQRLSIVEALAEAGGIAKTGDSKKVTILRPGIDGNLLPMTVDLKEIMAGKSALVYIQPGDQIIVPGKKISVIDRILRYSSILSFGRTFATGGAF